MTKQEKRLSGIRASIQTFSQNNKGSAIVMVLVAIAFVSVIGSMVMYSTFYNYKMKVTDRKAKDSFYSAQLAMEEINEGLKKVAVQVFSETYQENMQLYASGSSVDINKNLVKDYKKKLTETLAVGGGITDQYKTSVFQEFITEEHRATSKDAQGAFVDSDTCSLMDYNDGIRVKDLRVTYTDEQGYVSIIETDFLLACPNLGIEETFEFADIGEYCLIANEKMEVKQGGENGIGVILSGGVYAGKEGVTINASETDSVMLSVQDHDKNDGVRDRFITDGMICIGKDEDMTKRTPALIVSEDIDLWASGITLAGSPKLQEVEDESNDSFLEALIKAFIRWLMQLFIPGWDYDNTTHEEISYSPNLTLYGNSYIQDDLTINSWGSEINLGGDLNEDGIGSGTYTGFGNAAMGSDNSSAIILNGKLTKFNMSNLTELNLGGNAYIGTSKLDISGISDITAESNKNIKMGNAMATKVEQLAYLVPAECIGYDVEKGQTVIGKNPVMVTDKSYKQFMENVKDNPQKYKEVNLDLVDRNLGVPLRNFGATFEKIYFKTSQNSVWAYYYLKFASSADAAHYFEAYYNNDNISAEMKENMKQYIADLKTGNGTVNTAGNIIISDSTTGALNSKSATVSPDSAAMEQLNKKYAECNNKYTSLCKNLTEDYEHLTQDEMEHGVYDNIINTALIDEIRNFATDGYIIFKNTTAKMHGVLVLNSYGASVNLATIVNQVKNAVGSNFLNPHEVLLVVSEIPITLPTGTTFEGTVITKGSITLEGSLEEKATIGVSNSIQNALKGEFTYTHNGASKTVTANELFREAKGSEITNDGSLVAGATITADDLVVYENWTKK